jgi:hypothetical protein
MDHIVERLDQVRFKDQLAARSGQGNETQLLAA